MADVKDEISVALAGRLAGELPDDFTAAAGVLWRTLESATFTGWMTLPCGTYVARAGIDQPEIALPLLAGLTPRWSSEFPSDRSSNAMLTSPMSTCTAGPATPTSTCAASRRKEPARGCPGRRLRQLIADPTPNIALLDRLADDPSGYVRRSVANHLNDIAKDHPTLAVDLARQWLPRGAGAAWAARHGLRTLINNGHPDALELLGVTPGADIRLTALTVDRSTVAIGEAVTFTLTVELAGTEDTDAVIDYRVHHVGATGPRRPKVFKLTRAASHQVSRSRSPAGTASTTPPSAASTPAGTPSTSKSTAASSTPSTSTCWMAADPTRRAVTTRATGVR